MVANNVNAKGDSHSLLVHIEQECLNKEFRRDNKKQSKVTALSRNKSNLSVMGIIIQKKEQLYFLPSCFFTCLLL